MARKENFPNQKEMRAAHVYARAWELAESGKHRDYQTIEATIIAEGYPEARDLLDMASLRDDLTRKCKEMLGKMLKPAPASKHRAEVKATLPPEQQEPFDSLMDEYNDTARIHVPAWTGKANPKIIAELIKGGWRKTPAG